MSLHPNTQITYLGHSTFLIQTPQGKRILIDPFLKQNPLCPEGMKDLKNLEQVDVMLITHGHFDHIDDAVEIGKQFKPQVAATFEIASWLESKGVPHCNPMNKGGSLEVPENPGIKVTLEQAFHSSMIQDGDQTIYAGEPCSLVIQLEDGFTLFHAGDTMLFSDMKLIAEFHQPDVAFLPIGDRFTMGPRHAAKACEFLQVKKVIPMHYGTFPILTGTPEQFKKELEGTNIEMIECKPGESI